MNFIDRLEKRYPNFGVSNLMIYVIAISGLGMLISMVNPYIYYQYLSLDFYQIFHHGQVWRLITFLLCPSAGGSGSSGLFWFVIMAWVYYSIGSNLERIWGRFRFTLFYLSGIVMILIVTLAAYSDHGNRLSGTGSRYLAGNAGDPGVCNGILIPCFCTGIPGCAVFAVFHYPGEGKVA